MKEQIKTPEKEQNNKEIDNLSDTEFKTLVIRMHRIGWVWSQNEGRNEGYTKWNKVKYTGHQQWRKGNLDSNQRFGTEGRNKCPTRTEWRKNILKNEERLRNLYDNFKHSNIQIIGMPEGKEQEQENENLCEQIMGKKNLPQSGRSPGSSESPKEIGSKKKHTKAHQWGERYRE